jgi:hypothetical protein
MAPSRRYEVYSSPTLLFYICTLLLLAGRRSFATPPDVARPSYHCPVLPFRAVAYSNHLTPICLLPSSPRTFRSTLSYTSYIRPHSFTRPLFSLSLPVPCPSSSSLFALSRPSHSLAHSACFLPPASVGLFCLVASRLLPFSFLTPCITTAILLSPVLHQFHFFVFPHLLSASSLGRYTRPHTLFPFVDSGTLSSFISPCSFVSSVHLSVPSISLHLSLDRRIVSGPQNLAKFDAWIFLSLLGSLFGSCNIGWV